MSIVMGWYVMCHYPDDAPEPEGTILMQTEPKIGMCISLCDGQVYKITHINDHNMSLDVFPATNEEIGAAPVLRAYTDEGKLRIV